jgi:hypothetical protein
MPHLCCPSCGLHWSDVVTSHRYEFSGPTSAASMPDGTAKCADGKLLHLTSISFADLSALAAIDLINDVCRRESEIATP